MSKRQEYPRMTTQPVQVVDAWIRTPDVSFDKTGVHSLTWRMSEEDAQPLVKELRLNLKTYLDEMRAKGEISNNFALSWPYKPEKNDKDEETGFVYFRAKQAALITDAKGQTYSKKTQVYDSKAQVLSEVPPVYAGSKVRVNFSVVPWFKANKAGLTLRLIAVQILELAPGFDSNPFADETTDEPEGAPASDEHPFQA
jgi:hypothetical protein